MLGVSRLWDPPGGDQALFMLGASALHGGGVLYRDFWDLKQPGIFEFYLAAGIPFGFTPVAAHILGLGLWLVLSIAQIAALAPLLRRPALAAVAPLATAGAFFLGATIRDFGQPEAIAGTPLFLSLCLFVASFTVRRGAVVLACAAGLSAGLAVIDKLLFGAIAIAAIVAAGAAIGPPPRRVVWRLVCFSCCAVLPSAVYLAAAAAQHELVAVIYTWFVLPERIIAALPHAPASRLLGDVRLYVVTFALPIALAAVALCSKMTPEARPWRNAMLAWIAAAAVVIVVQRFSWWEYHFILFVVPIGTLATLGSDALVERLARYREPRRRLTLTLAVCVAVAISVLPLARAERRLATLIATNAPFSRAGAERYRRAQSREYAEAGEVAALLPRRGPRPTSIFVAGDPLVFTLSDTVSHVPINGWGLELLLPSQWTVLEGQLTAARPDDVFVNPSYALLIARQSPSIVALLRREYRVAEQSRLGTWYSSRQEMK